MSYEENRYRDQVITELSGIRKALEKSNELMEDYIKTKTTLFISDDKIKPLYSGDNTKGSLRDIEIFRRVKRRINSRKSGCSMV